MVLEQMINDPDIIAAVIGHPVDQSKSPLIHNHWLERDGRTGTYTALDIAPNELPARAAALRSSHLTGFNVTIPHKEVMLSLCDEIDDTARMIGAVNTVTIQDKRLIGTNTDAYGFIENVRQNTPDADFTAGPALVLGAGGAARAIIYGLLNAGVPEILLTNRTQARAESLSDMFGPRVRVVSWESKERHLKEVAFVVNTTSLGMNGQPPLEIDIRTLPGRAIVCDIVYHPLETDLLKNAMKRECRVVSGLGMLFHQAAEAYALWFGQKPEIDAALFQKIEERL